MIDMQLIDIVGKDNVTDNPEALKEYSGDSSFAPPKTPTCVVRPANIEMLKDIVIWANKKQVPLVPVSSGPPHFRGDTVPFNDGAVIVDLRGMNKIIRVNADDRVAIIEPGVTYGELQAELAKSGLSAYLPLSPRSSKSVMTSVLEREPITMPCIHFDSTDPMLCTEIVFGTGDTMRTGEAAGPDSLEKQWEIGKSQISPFGPTQMDPQRLVSGSQGTIGIVTWMSLKCRFLSSHHRAFLLPSESLEPLVELCNKLVQIRFTGNIFILNGLNLACLQGRTTGQIEALSKKTPDWVLFVSCEGYGPLPEEKVQYLEEDLKEIAASYGVTVEADLNGIDAMEVSAMLSRPSENPYWKQRLKGNFAEIFFLTTLGRTAEFASRMAKIAKQHGYPDQNIGAYMQPTVMGTSCHCEFDLYYDPENQAECELTQKVVADAADKMEADGAFFSRPYREWVDVAYRRSDVTADIQKKVKGIFDPNGILNPGHLCFR